MYRVIKRIIGFIIALVLVILCSPFLLLISIAIKLDSKGPVIFKQERTGYKGKNFMLYKFRSMSCDNDVHDFSKQDQHTKVGTFIRKTSLDELPQLFNILKGDMAFIGPRPWITDYYENMTKKQRRRCDVLPGITGLAQANGRNSITIFDKINYDLEYVRNMSFFLDIKIIFLTVKAVLSKKGADAGKGTIQDELEDLKTYKKNKKNNEEDVKKVLFTATVDSHILHFHIPFLKLFKEKGYEVHVATNGNEEIPYCDVKHVISFARSPFKISNLKAIKQLKRVINEEKFEIIHCHTPMGSVVTRLAAKKARKNGTRVIYTAHGFHFFKGAPLLNWLLFYPVEKYLSKYTDTLITINKEDYELAEKKFIKCKNIEYVPGVGIDPKKFDFEFSKDEQQKLRKSLGLKDKDFVMIYPAELSKRKRQIWLINSIKDLLRGNKKLHLLLPGQDSLNGECQELVKSLNLEEQIHFLGYRKDIPKLLKISDIAISSANQEGLPVNIMEAMYVGLPIVASNCRGNRDLVKDGENGYLIDLDDNDKYSSCIEELYKNKKIYTGMIENNKKEISNYMMDKIIVDMEKIYSNKKTISLIIPCCTDLNRGDQALVYETASIIKETYNSQKIYMMANEKYTEQCEKEGILIFSDILKHPSRFGKTNKNINYSFIIKIKWGIVAVFDFLCSLLILNNLTRKIAYIFLSADTKKSLDLYKECEACFVKGGGFLHDYSGGIIGIYTTYYHLFHIKLALKMQKKVYVMPNSFGPFKSKISKNMTFNVLKKCNIVTSRESISSNGNTNGLGLDIDLKPDLAFFLKKNETFNVEKYFETKNIPLSDKYVAITVRPYRFYGFDNPAQKYENYKNTFSKFIVWLNELGYKPLLVVHTRAINDHENDEKCINEICEKISDKSLYNVLKDDCLSCRELKAIYGKCEFIIGTRFHSVIFGISQNVPAISITYGGNKGDGITKDINNGIYSIKIEDLTFECLKDKFLELSKNKKEEIKRIEKYLDKCNKERKKMITLINEEKRK